MGTDTLEPQPRGSYSRGRLYFAASVASSLYIIVGLFLGWPSPALVLLQSRNFTNSQYTLLASIPNLAPGPLITMFGIDLIGRKFTLLVIWFTLLVTYIIMLISENVYVLMIARFLGGWCMSTFSAVGIYISEISDVQSRNALNSMSMIFYSLGSILVCSIGPFTSITVISVVSLAVTLILGVLLWFLPESPIHLINKGLTDEAYTTLVWLRRKATKKEVEDELREIQISIDEEKKQKVGLKKILTSKVVWKQFGIAWYILAVQQISLLVPLGVYTQTIFESAKLTFNAAYVPIALNIICLLFSFLTPFFIKKSGSRKLFIVSSIGGSASIAALGGYFLMLEKGYAVSSISWFPISVTVIFFLFGMTGYGGLVWSVVSDMFAPSIKGYATGISGIIATLMEFSTVHLFGLAIYEYNFGITFLVWSLVFFVSSFGVIFIPNLTHMTLPQIQDYFEGKKNKPTKLLDINK